MQQQVENRFCRSSTWSHTAMEEVRKAEQQINAVHMDDARLTYIIQLM